MLDRDLAELYELEAKYLKRQVKRKRKHRPKAIAGRATSVKK